MNARYYPGHTPSGCGLQRVGGPGAGFYLKRYCSVEFEQPCEGLGYMPESPPFTPWSPFVSPSLLKYLLLCSIQV